MGGGCGEVVRFGRVGLGRYTKQRGGTYFAGEGSRGAESTLMTGGKGWFGCLGKFLRSYSTSARR